MADPEIYVTLKPAHISLFWPEAGTSGQPSTQIRWIFEAMFTDDKAKYGANGYGASVEGAIAALWVDYRIIRRLEERNP